jgi:hypothetical protein
MPRGNYRQPHGTDTFHFCKNCSNWPTVDYDSQSSKPTTGEFCDECLANEKADNCT